MRRNPMLLVAVLVLSTALVESIVPAFAADPGDLDTAFGIGGKVSTDFGARTGALDVAQQVDGKLVAAGRAAGGFGLARYHADGFLDSAFGEDGKVTGDFYDSVTSGSARAVLLQEDGKIVAAGTFNNGIALARYDSSGSLDSEFGVDGLVTYDFGGAFGTASSAALQSDGKIVVAGWSGGDVAVVRFTGDGSLDTTFGSGGLVLSDVAPYNGEIASGIVIQPDGRIVVAGTTDWVTTSNADVLLIRYNVDGSLDASFGTGGVVNLDVGVPGEALSLALQPDGKLVVAGRTFDDDILVVRYASDGSIDEDFGLGGVVVTDLGSVDVAYDLALDVLGRIVVAGATQTSSGPTSYDFAIVRYSPAGTLDAGFGSSGAVLTDASFERALAVIVQSDGRIVASGITSDSSNFALARYMPGNTPPVAVDDGPLEVRSGRSIDGNVLDNDTDADMNPLAASVVDGVSHGLLTFSNSGEFSYTADVDFIGSDSFTYTAHDGTDESNVATVTIEVTPVPSQVGLVDPASGVWNLRNPTAAVLTFFYGNPGDVPFLGDWDCDGEATPGLFRQSDAFAYLRNSNTQGIADIRFFFGNPSDIPLAGDFNGDGCDTLSIYRPSEAKFYIMNDLGDNEGGLGAADYSFLFGNVGDKPVVGDWDGDGVDEIGLHRETTGFFYYRNTLTTGVADGQLFFGDPGDRFVAGDWGVVDGIDTPGMFRPSNSTFYFRHTLTQGNADSEFIWNGAAMDWLPVSGDFTVD
jgi:uncharacterized delta-60 repeat protein